jgi:hypothetical protein
MEKNKLIDFPQEEYILDIIQAYMRGETIKYFPKEYPKSFGTFDKMSRHTEHLGWDFFRYDYEILKVPDYINWDHVHSDFKFMMRRKTGSNLLVTLKPKIENDYWVIGNDKWIEASHFSSLKVGNMHWRESLISRPGVPYV